MNRDPKLWRRVVDHPSVAPHIVIGQDVYLDIETIVGHPRVYPFAGAHGGFLFFAIDVIGTVFEVHAMIEPRGRGRAAWRLGVQAFEEMFAGHARVIIAHQTAWNAMSAPPKTFGFVPAGDWAGPFRPWVLTRDKWFASPSHSRMKTCLQH